MKAEDWIKVEDRLPEIGEEVLVAGYFDGTGNMETWFTHRSENKVSWKDKNDFCIYESGCRITHWMPIVLPKEEKK